MNFTFQDNLFLPVLNRFLCRLLYSRALLLYTLNRLWPNLHIIFSINSSIALSIFSPNNTGRNFTDSKCLGGWGWDWAKPLASEDVRGCKEFNIQFLGGGIRIYYNSYSGEKWYKVSSIINWINWLVENVLKRLQFVPGVV